MIPSVILPVIRRAILDLLEAIGGEHNEQSLVLQLRALGHRVGQEDIAEQLLWLDQAGLVVAEALGPFTVARIVPRGCDVATDQIVADGVSRHRTPR